MRIKGHIDQFLSSFEIIIENFEIIKSFAAELAFNQSLQKNQERIDKTNIFNLNTLLVNSNKTDRNKYINSKKNFSNRILAFFQNFRLENEVEDENFIQVNLDDLLGTRQFMSMLNEVCQENYIEDEEKFLRECFVLLEEEGLGKLDNNIVEIKTNNDKIKREILSCFKKDQAVSYLAISEHISKQFNGYYCNDYVRFILNELIRENVIFQNKTNTYELAYNNFNNNF